MNPILFFIQKITSNITIAPAESIITPFIDEVHPGTIDWCHSSKEA
ncbi:hypothetical protein [Aquibacillus albus]|uniref:Uncharacterized protein n=1 Tax=Aquibacillus albus TaxID=1168171 RepID=A0ABS2MWI2_9BACI|nr:hypothetical protein [Aquibacillus albus]MBM7570060.1 hypothetical protein [Aquibacillus albus]